MPIEGQTYGSLTPPDPTINWNPGVEESLKEIEASMQEVLARREKILKTSRDCISFCSKAIVHIHTGKPDEAHSEIREAEKILKALRKEATVGALSRYLPSPRRSSSRRRRSRR